MTNLIRWFLAVSIPVVFWCCCSAFVHAQDPPASVLKRIDIGMPTARIVASPEGEFVVCLQEVADPNNSKPPGLGEQITKVIVVDLNRQEIVATREMTGLRPSPVAVSRQWIFLATIRDEILKLSLADLQTVKQSTHNGIGYPGLKLFAIGDRWLCSADGKVWLDQQELTPAEQTIASADYIRRNQNDRLIGPAQEGWRIGSEIYDRDLKLVVLAPAPNDNRSISYKRPNTVRRGPDFGQGMRSDNVYRDPELGCLAYAVVPEALPETEIPITLKLVNYDDTILASTSLGELPVDLAKLTNGRNWIWKSRASRSESGAGHTVIPLIIAGSRMLVTFQKMLCVWELDPQLLAQIARPLRIVQTEPQLLVDFHQPTVFKYSTLGGNGPVTFHASKEFNRAGEANPLLQVTPNGELTVEPSRLLGPETIRNHLTSLKLFQKNDVTEYAEKYYGDQMRRISGRAPRGLPSVIVISLAATEQSGETPQTADMVHSVVTEIPEDVYVPLLKYPNPAQMPDLASRGDEDVGLSERDAKSKLEATRQKQAQDEINARLLEEATAKQKADDQRRHESFARQAEREHQLQLAKKQDQTRPVIWGLSLVVTLALLGAPGWYFLTHPPMVGKTSIRGAMMAACGLLPMLTLIGLSYLEGNYGVSRDQPDVAARTVAYGMAAFSFLLFATLMMLGTVVTVIDKGKSSILGIVLGLISPLGLLIAIMLPAEPTASPASNDSKKRPGQPRRTRTVPKPDSRRQ